MNKSEKQALIGALRNLDKRLKNIENAAKTNSIEVKIDSNNKTTIKFMN